MLFVGLAKALQSSLVSPVPSHRFATALRHSTELYGRVVYVFIDFTKILRNLTVESVRFHKLHDGYTQLQGWSCVFSLTLR